MRIVYMLFFLTICFSSNVLAQDLPRVEIFTGYTYTNINFPPSLELVATDNLTGFNASITGNITKNFGLVGEFSGTFSSTQTQPSRPGAPPTSPVNRFTFLAGPRFTIREDRYNVFFHTLFGGVRTKIDFANTPLSETKGAAAIGGGLDVKITEKIYVRLFQIDAILSKFQDSKTRTSGRISIGAVFHLGKN